MPVYEFRCPRCGVFEQKLPMSRSGTSSTCPTCDSPAPRRFSSPGTLLGNSTARRLIDETAATAHEPAFVAAPKSGASARRPVSSDPRHARLPRPE